MMSLLFKVVEAVKPWKSIVVSMVRAQTLFIIIIIIIISHSSRERLLAILRYYVWEVGEGFNESKWGHGRRKKWSWKERREGKLTYTMRKKQQSGKKRNDKTQPDGRKGGQEEEKRPINSLFYWRCRTGTKRVSGANQQVSAQKGHV